MASRGSCAYYISRISRNSVREGNTSAKMVHSLLERDTEEFNPKMDEHRTASYAGGSHTALRRTAPDEAASYELRTGGEAAWV
jgi:hypothetical protein